MMITVLRSVFAEVSELQPTTISIDRDIIGFLLNNCNWLILCALSFAFFLKMITRIIKNCVLHLKTLKNFNIIFIYAGKV